MPYDPSTDAGKVRLLIADTAASVFTDAEITAFLDLASQDVILAAAYGSDSLASLYARKSNRLTVLDIQVDFTQAAKALQAQAKQFRDQVAENGGFSVAAMVDSGLARQERRRKELEIQGLGC